MTTLLSPAVSILESDVDRYVRLEHEKRMIEARQAELLGRIDAAGEHEDEGYLSAAALLRDRLGISGGDASSRVSVARGLRRHPDVAEPFTRGEIDLPRVRLLLDAAAVAPAQFSHDGTVLLDRVADLSMKHVRRAVAYWKQAADQRAAEADAEHLHRRRRLHVSQTFGGMVRVDGELDPDGGQVVLTALRSLADPQNLDPDDTRTPAQRRADALVDVCADHLTHGDPPTTGQVRPHVAVVVSGEALAGTPVEPCEYDDGIVLTTHAARLIACDSTVTRVVMDGDSQVLDVGRATRTIPPAIRLALVVRDGHCQWSGCDRPHRWCDAHHIVHWADGGPTGLDNLTLLCRRHHRMAHDEAPIPPQTPKPTRRAVTPTPLRRPTSIGTDHRRPRAGPDP